MSLLAFPILICAPFQLIWPCCIFNSNNDGTSASILEVRPVDC